MLAAVTASGDVDRQVVSEGVDVRVCEDSSRHGSHLGRLTDLAIRKAAFYISPRI